MMLIHREIGAVTTTILRTFYGDMIIEIQNEKTWTSSTYKQLRVYYCGIVLHHTWAALLTVSTWIDLVVSEVAAESAS